MIGEPLRVLHLYSGNLYGGVESFLVTLARCRDLCPEMVSHFGLCFRGRLWDELTAAGVSVHDLGEVRISRPWTVLRARRRLRSLLRSQRFDVAVAHMGWPHAVFAPVVLKADVRLVHALHSVVDRRHWLNRWAARTPPDLVIANSDFIARNADGWCPNVPMRTCHLPVPPPTMTDREAVRAEVRRELGTPPESVVILQASRLEDWKGQRVHIEALSRLRDVPDWEAWLAGGPQRDGEAAFLAELRDITARLGIGHRVRFLGQRSDVPRLMRAADIYCQPNTSPEPFGVVFVEALFAGLPVVTSDFGGGAEIIDKSCGRLTPPGDPEAVAIALGELIRDPVRRAALGSGGPTRARELCDPARQLMRWAELVTEAVRC